MFVTVPGEEVDKKLRTASVAGGVATPMTFRRSDTPETVMEPAVAVVDDVYRDNHRAKEQSNERTIDRNANCRIKKPLETWFLERLGHSVSGIVQRQRVQVSRHFRRH